MMAKAPTQNEIKTKSDAPPDFSQVFQKQMLYMVPFIIGFVSFQFAIGLSLYWNTFTIFGIIQQYKMQGLGGLSGWVERLRMQTKI